MFTGIIEEIGYVLRKTPQGEGFLFKFQAQNTLIDLKNGDSIAVNGVCQTIMEKDSHSFTVFSIPATLEASNLRFLKEGDLVNLERPLRLQDRLSGHLVQGHVEGLGEVISTEEGLNFRRIAIGYSSPYLVPKGSVAVDGISLTIQKIEGGVFWVELIPETLSRTNARLWKKGDLLNIETDFLVRVVAQLLEKRSFPK